MKTVDQYTRRQFNGLMVAGLSALTFGACGREERRISSLGENSDVETIITEDRVKGIAHSVAEEYNRVFGFSYAPEAYADSIRLMQTSEDFIDAYLGYSKQYNYDASRHVAFVSSAKETFVNREAFDSFMEPLRSSGERFPLVQDDLMSFFIAHEFAHFSTERYESEIMKWIVFEGLYRKSVEEKGQEVIRATVDGAKVIGETASDPIIAFGGMLEEAEAELITEYVVSKRPSSNRHVQYPPTYIPVGNRLLKELFNKMEGTPDEHVTTLAMCRTQIQGREQWLAYISDRLSVTDNDQQVWLGAALQHTIDNGDEAHFNRLLSEIK